MKTYYKGFKITWNSFWGHWSVYNKENECSEYMDSLQDAINFIDSY